MRQPSQIFGGDVAQAHPVDSVVAVAEHAMLRQPLIVEALGLEWKHNDDIHGRGRVEQAAVDALRGGEQAVDRLAVENDEEQDNTGQEPPQLGTPKPTPRQRLWRDTGPRCSSEAPLLHGCHRPATPPFCTCTLTARQPSVSRSTARHMLSKN